MLVRCLIAAIVVTGALVSAGCNQRSAADPAELKAQRSRFLLTAEPEGAVGVLDARDASPHGGPVVLVGRIGGTQQPWVLGKAAFVIVDPTCGADVEHSHHGPDDNCPFCAQKKPQSESLAIVQFHDQRGQLLALDAKELFELGEDQTVVVKGEAKVNELGTLVVMASGIYVRR